MERTNAQMGDFARQASHRIAGLRQGIARVTGRLSKRFARLGRWRIALVALLLLAFIAPVATIGATAYTQYSQLKNWGLDGVHQLLAIKSIVDTATSASPATTTPSASATPGPTAKPSPIATPSGGSASGITQKAQDLLSPTVLAEIKQHCDAANSDFTHINTSISQRQGILGFAMITPYASKIVAAQQLAVIGIDAAGLCTRLTVVGNEFTKSFATSPFSSTGGPILTTKSFNDLQAAVDDVQATLTDIQSRVQQVNLSQVPVSQSQLATLKAYIPKLPKILNDIATFKPYLPLAGWALGVDQSRTYLIQTMDRAELRPSGGFNGSYGLLSINGGRLGNISLTDVSEIYPIGGPLAPKPYTWWPFPNWGLRDANLSGDFPTSAKLSMGSYTAVAKTHLDGLITFSPLVIENMLKPSVLGPLFIPCYNVTITSTNLENELHYYQLGAGQAKQNVCSKNVTGTTKRKRFTAELASDLQNRVRSASQQQLLAIVNGLRQDLVTKDLEIYVNNSQIESLLAKDHLDAAAVTDPKVDATYVVQANIGVNKASQYVAVNQTENITLDASGGAYHDLIMQFTYIPTGPVYGVTTYRDYVRVYVPPQAQFLGGQGFDQLNQPPMCYLATPSKDGKLPPPKVPPGGGPPVPYFDVAHPCQPQQSALCQSGQFAPAQAPYGLPNTEGSDNAHIDQIAGPTNMASDIPGRAMFGGLVIVPANCEGAIVLQWYVPNVAGTAAHNNLPYTFIEQRQSGTSTVLNLSIEPASGTTAQPITVTKPISQDLTFILALPAKKHDS